MFRSAPLFLSTLLLTSTTFASPAVNNQTDALSQAAISLQQAIQLSEQQVGGKAVSADFEHSLTGWQYEVNVLKNGLKYEAQVDADMGAVSVKAPTSH
ncbi:PepSY domain-containing protein [Paludibacterium sp. B53371]|uniref:PepSY domain-containing protein n=1 Tax=Paludibacterium sp. B53371 TaxID=2806263 RepID=UPI001C03FD12|nr:PepSY domain-containing protein [Paludibacterium sp. B53371]